MYGSIYAGPALQESDAPVVRYQDLHRKHAPASAGAPEFGMVAFDGQAQFGDVAFDGQPQIPSSGFGDVAFDGQPQMPSSGFGYTRADAGYAAAETPDVFTFTDPANAQYKYRVTWNVNPIKIEMLASPSGKTGEVERGTKAYQSILDLAVDLDSKGWKPDASTPKKADKKDEDEESGWEKFTEAFTRGVSSAGKGVSRGLSSKPKRGGFQASGRDIEPVRGGDDKRADESNVGKYALYAVGGLAGLTLLVVGIKAAMGGGESE